jgi:peptide deformylase
MYNTMHKAHGIGLASPQIGKDIALTVIDLTRTEDDKKIKFEPLTLINPVIKDFHGEVIMEEGCLSIPLVRAEVTRPETVFLEYQDIDLNKQYVEINGLLARVVQHEVDHLNGILFTDHLNKDEKKNLKAELNKIKKGDIATDYLLAELPKQKHKAASKKSRH